MTADIPEWALPQARQLHAVAHRNYKEDTILIFATALASVAKAERERAAGIALKEDRWDDEWDDLCPDEAIGRNVAARSIAVSILADDGGRDG